ncbi:MAG: 3-phosphoshikimate 1-carboxyvinyltransferase [Acidimicrobiales bacterium]
MTNRALVVAGLAEGVSQVRGGLTGDDAEAMVAGLRGLGVEIVDLGESAPPESRGAPSWTISGTAGHLARGSVVIDADLAGTALRFLTAVAALGEGEITVTGQEQLLARPVGPFLEALRRCGADVQGSGPEGDHGPITVKGRRGPLGGHVLLDASKSSQFVTALLLVAPYFDEPLVLDATGLGAGGFVDLTIEIMAAFGIAVRSDGRSYAVDARSCYRAADYLVPPDASAASHLFALGMATGGEVTVELLGKARSQPDFAVVQVFEQFGARVTYEPGSAVTVTAPDRLSPVHVDLRQLPDQLPNVAVLAALAKGTSRIEGVGITRFHETDRMAAVRAELAKVGTEVELDHDAIVVKGGRAHSGAELSSHDDHRMAMALAALAAALGECSLTGAEAVSKTYRDFWADAQGIGLEVDLQARAAP